MEVWLNELEKLRDPDAHRRELLPHQKHLILGIAGEIRTKLIRYRSKMETNEDIYPRIESLRDSVGNIYTYGSQVKDQLKILNPGDTIDFVVTASDPLGEEIKYGMTIPEYHSNPVWQKENTFSLRIENIHVQEKFGVMFWIRSLREFHANKFYDDSYTFYYNVRQPKK